MKAGKDCPTYGRMHCVCLAREEAVDYINLATVISHNPEYHTGDEKALASALLRLYAKASRLVSIHKRAWSGERKAVDELDKLIRELEGLDVSE